MRRSSVHVATAVALAVAVTAAGCARGSSSGVPGGGEGGDGVVTLTFQSLAWQTDAVASTAAIVEAWNAENPDVQVEIVQGDWASVNDDLLTAFEGGTAPDVLHFESGPLRDLLERGSVLPLQDLLSDDIRRDVREGAWDTVTFDGDVAGVPFLQESQVMYANATLLEAAGVPLPTVEDPWTWDELGDVARRLTVDADGDGTPERYGTAFSLRAPANRVLNLAMAYDGEYFTTSEGVSRATFGAAEAQVPRRIHDLVWTDRTASPDTVGLSAADALPGFFAGQYATMPGAVWLRQQLTEQAPDGFEWVTLPPLEGDAGSTQGAVSQTLSVSADTAYPQEAVAFVEHVLGATNQVALAQGDWMLPTSQEAQAAPELTTAERGWDVVSATADDLEMAPFQQVAGFEEWKTRVANPALQEYFADQITLEELGRRFTEDGDDVLARYDR